MSTTTFFPAETLELFCRFCEKISPCQLERSIAGNGRTIDRNGTFEYYCAKCFKTVCFSGNDLIEQPKPDSGKVAPRAYSPHDHYCIGEHIVHNNFKDKGLVVNIDSGTPNRILVQFEKGGLKKLVEDI